MKIQLHQNQKYDKVILIPEHDLDCYNLGQIANQMYESCMNMTSTTDNPKPKINGLEIPVKALIKFIIDKCQQ